MSDIKKRINKLLRKAEEQDIAITVIVGDFTPLNNNKITGNIYQYSNTSEEVQELLIDVIYKATHDDNDNEYFDYTVNKTIH